MTISIGFFINDGFQALDLFGPLDTFMETNSFKPNSYSCTLISRKHNKVKASHGQVILCDHQLATASKVNYLVICGGVGMRNLILTLSEKKLLRQLADDAKRVISICTGSFVLSQLYDDKSLSLTTHWRHCHQLRNFAQHCTVDEKPLFIGQNEVWSSAGVLSGVDLALEIIRQDFSSVIAAKVAKELVVYLQRKGGQSQFSDTLAIQSSDSYRLSSLIDWLSHNIDKNITVNQMAEFVHLGERQLTRLFKKQFNLTPSLYFRKLKLNSARDTLSNQTTNLEQLALKVGFKSYDSFRRAFEKEFGLSPSTYKEHNKL